jgi:NADH:ubiquinone oxidoreductase subunit 6 (subunit J)
LDTLHSVLFYAFAALTVGGGLVTSLLGGRARALGVAAVGVGLAGLYADLDAGYAALVILVALGACAVLLLGLAGPRFAAADLEPAGLARQLGAALAGVVFLALAYVAFRGRYAGGTASIGAVNAAAVGRLLLGREALGVEALAAALLVAVAAGGLIARGRPR